MIVRGCEKRIYHVKNTESDLFDEAYFVLKVGGRRGSTNPRELEREAMRLVNGVSDTGSRACSIGKRERLKAFLLGSLFSCGAIGIVSVILWLAL